MTFALSTLKGVKVYNLTFGKTSEQWREEKRLGHINSLRYNEAYRRRVEFIQDAVFEVACTKVLISPDNEWMLATGVYPPKVKMYDFSQLSMKFERGLESESLDALFLSENWEKFVILREHRWIEFHSRHGKHYNMRLPIGGTCLSYNPPMCELYIGSTKNIVLRANLEEGRYFTPYETDIDHINTCDIDKTHLLCSFGGINGIIECWDPRQKKRVSKLDLYDSVPNITPTPEITKLKFGNDGLTLGCGTSNGYTLIYDLRRKKPLHELNQRNKISIRDIHFHDNSDKIITVDAKTIRYWNKLNGDLYTVITPSENIHNIGVCGNSGVIFTAQEQHRIGSYYLPSVGVAPKWCPFLDNMTEELEESKFKSIYVDYKFVSRDELEALGLEHIIGTDLLKAYMHGFFMDLRLYSRVRQIVNPDEYEKYLKEKAKEKIKHNRNNRIKIKGKLPDVNKLYAKKLISNKVNNKNNSSDLNALLDPRFKQLFENKDFEIDMENDYYLKYHPEIKYALKDEFPTFKNEDEIKDDVLKQYLKSERQRYGSCILPKLIIDDDDIKKYKVFFGTNNNINNNINNKQIQYKMYNFKNEFGDEYDKERIKKEDEYYKNNNNNNISHKMDIDNNINDNINDNSSNDILMTQN